MRIELLGPHLVEEYEAYLHRRSDSLFYHGSAYKNFLRSLLGCEEAYLLALDAQGVRGALPLLYIGTDRGRIYNSLPYHGSNGGILADTPLTAHLLIEAYDDFARADATTGATLIENPFAERFHSRVSHNYTDIRIAQFTDLPVPGNATSELLARIDPSARRNVRKAWSAGVKVEKDAAQIHRLREIHEANIAALGGVAKKAAFFAEFPHHFAEGADYDLYVARREGEIIAALLVFYFNETVEYYIPAIMADHRSLQPLAAILMEAMSEAAERGFRRWNWGGTWTSQEGVYRFKRKWGAQERHYSYYTQLNDPSLLDWSSSQIVDTFPNFFAVPFAALRQTESTSE